LANKKFSAKESVLRFCTNTLLINFLCVLVKEFVFNTAGNPLLADGDMTPSTAAVYMAMSMIFGLVIALFEVLLSKKVKVAVEETPDEEKKD
ncbi:MAG: hypothetical protein IK086_07790, partial [Clostridia bacterium]|nr:hypothetical protein [Clostridia bacterium]